MLFCTASASASLPLRVASITRFTAAMSSGETAATGAGSKRPDSGCATGLNKAGLAVTGPRRATLLGTGADAPAAGNGRLRGSGTWRTTCTAGGLAAWMAGLGWAAGTFLGAPMAVWALKAPAAVSARAKPKVMPRRLPLGQYRGRKDSQNPHETRHIPQAGRKRGGALFIKPIHGPI